MLLKTRAAALAGVCFLAFGAPAAAETLADALAMAYQTNPQLQAQRARLRATDEQYVQARSQFRPSADLSSEISGLTVNYNDVTRDPRVGDPNLGVSAGVGQNLYTGGRASNAVREVEGNILAGREQLRSLENDIMQAVVQAYVDVRRDQEVLRVRQENVDVLRRQLEETQARFEVGEITRTDVAQSEARLAQARAFLSTAQATLATNRANYATLVGQSPGTLEPEPVLPGLPASVEQAYDRAQVNNPDLLTAEFFEQASRARVARERAETRPSVRASASAAYRQPLDHDLSDYSATLGTGATLSLPLYRGGATTSRIRAARETNTADRIAVETTRRNVVQQVAQFWNSLQAQRAAMISNDEQVRAARVAFEGVQAEAQAGLRTTLDVLNAQTELRNAELSFLQSRRDAYVASAALLNVMGMLEPRNLGLAVPAYDPAANFNRIRGSHALPWEGAIEGLDQIGAPQPEARPVSPPAVISKAPAQGDRTASLDALVDASLARR